MRKKQRHGRRVGLLVLGIAVFLSLAGASDPRLPLVIRTDRAQVPVPVECETGLSLAPSLRVDLREIPLPEPEPAEAVAPPSGSLRAALAGAQTALVANDREAFDDALARSRAMTEAHPAGGERRAAEELVRIYDGARRLWDAQFESPFFGEDSAEYASVSAYPGYAEAMRRNTITDASDRRFYPAVESRAFLTSIAADRLRSLGVRSPARPSRPERTPVITAEDDTAPLPPIRPRPSARRSSAPGLSAPGSSATGSSASSSRPSATSRRPSATGSSRRSTSGTSTSRPRTTTASAAPAPSSSGASTTTQTRKPAAVTSTSSMPNPSTPPTTTAVPRPAAPPVATPLDTAPASSPAAGDSPSPIAADVPPTIDEPTDTAITETTPDTETTLTTPPVTTTTAPAPTPADTRPLRNRSVVLPAILILIGLAVLIVLFRASK